MEASDKHMTAKLTRPGYILVTNQGIYNGMIKHNLVKSLSTACQMSSMSFTEMYPMRETLRKFTEQTTKQPADYFNLLRPSELGHSSSTSPVMMLTPFNGCETPGKHASLAGFHKTHQEYMVNKRAKVTIKDDYLPMVA
jgi:hypothetical protein